MHYTAIKELELRLKPNTFVTLTAKQGISCSSGAFIPASHASYEKAIYGLWKSVNIRLYGKRQWRRRKRLLPNLSVIEQSPGGMWHIHACVRRPPHVTIEKFRSIVDDCWKRSQWSMRRLQVDDYTGGGVNYILKDGQDAILVKSLWLGELTQ